EPDAGHACPSCSPTRRETHAMRLRTKLALTGVAVSSLGVGGVAFAAWTSNGAGSGTGQATHDQASTISHGVYAADLYPGAHKTITVTIDNPNDYDVVVNSISAGSSDAVGGCAAASVTTDARVSDTSGPLVQTDNQTSVITH